MLLKKLKSPLQKALKKHEHLMKEWAKDSFNDGSIEEITYTKEKIKIIFQEDLREHIVNLRITHPIKRYINVEYRQCLHCADSLDCDGMIKALEGLGGVNNVESEEVSIYFDFLIKNKIVGY